MPKGEKRNNATSIASGDFNLSDFADCPVSGRVRKSAANYINNEVKDVLWFERDLDEFDLDVGSDTECKIQKRKWGKTTKTKIRDPSRKDGFVFPFDVWFLISRYIKPEDVRTFALICKTSYSVTRSYTFWMDLYKRHYTKVTTLPNRLSPGCIEGAFCLKTCVVRALYHMYPLFTKQISARQTNSDVYALANLCCTSMWKVQQNGNWIFHFKFQTPDPKNLHSTHNVAIRRLWRNPDSETEVENYVYQNPDQGCQILKVSCSHFVAVPPCVMGSRLSNVSFNLAQDMLHEKLQLAFCYANYKQPPRKLDKQLNIYGDIVVFDPVENLSVFNWWHPQYPTS